MLLVFFITVNDGEEDVLLDSRDINAIFKAMMTTDEDYLLVSRETKSTRYGWVRFIYGNSGWDVINDYTTNLEETLKLTNKLIEEMSE